MKPAMAEAAWRTVVDADPTGFDADEVAKLLQSIAAVRSACDAAEVQAVRRSRALSSAGQGPSPEHLLANETGRSGRDARAAATREAACEAMPALENALCNGNVSAGHVDAAAAAHCGLSEPVGEAFSEHADVLVARAGRLGVDAFAKECRDLARHLTAQADRDAEVAELQRQQQASSVKRWVDRSTGMHNTLISLDPLRDAKMWKVISAQVGRERQQRTSDKQPALPFAALQATAVVEAVTAERSTSGSKPIPEISVLIDYATLVGDVLSTGGVCETDDATPLPPTILRRMACDAGIIPILLGSDGELLDQGRGSRTATPQQRTALAAMHTTCAFPGCTVGFSACRIHHVRFWWEHLGPTDLANLLPLCEEHHHLVHEGGWMLALDLERIATWTRPDGVVHHHGSTIDRTAKRPDTNQSPSTRTRDRRPRDVPLRL